MRTTLIGALAALLLSAGTASADGDPVKGEALYERCLGCHSIDRNRVGPMHRGLFGRAAGSVAEFNYSKAMRNSGIVWDDAALDRFLADPRGMVPGTRMTYAGIADPRERADLIAYLKAATQ